MDVRIGVTQAPRELSLELADDTDRDALRREVDEVLADEDRVLWLTDRRGKAVAVPARKIAYVEIGSPDDDRRIGFGELTAPVPLPLLDRRLVFVTGKGGVGKTTVAGGLGLLAAREGRSVLVVEVDAKGSLAGTYETDPLTFDPREVQPRLRAMAMNTEDSLREYLKLQLRVPLIARIGPLARTLDFVATAAPGVKEILTVGKIAWEVRERHYDLVVVDAVATGHIVGQLTAPQTINDLVNVGPVREQTRWMLDLLHDPDVTGVLIVTSPEEMPVNETIELADRLQDETECDLAGVVVNRVLPELFGRSEEDVFEALRTPPAVDTLTAAAGPGTTAVLEAAELAVNLRRTRAGHLERLRASVPPALPVLYLPELFARAPGLRTTGQVADALRDELV